MDYKLSKEIYSSAWFIDPLSLNQYSKTLEFFQNGGSFDDKQPKANQYGILSESNVFKAGKIARMDIIPQGTIAQYNFDSVITKDGGMSHHGTKDIAAQFQEMESNENVIGHLFNIESGGGAANAIKYIRDYSAKGVRSKPLVVFAEDIMASAAMYIASDADYIIANSKEAIIGSIGTMIQTEGFKNGSEDKTGKRHLRIYATQSVNKNKEFEDAINDLNYDLIRSTILDPHAATFIKDMEANRPNITALQKTGKIFRAEEVVGTLIDGIGTYESAIFKVKELAELGGSTEGKVNNTPKAAGSSNNNNLKIESMDLVKLKAEHPAVYAQAVAIGDEQGESREKDRTGAFMAFIEIDPKAVAEKVKSGENMTQTFMAEMSVKQMGAAKVVEMEKESPKPTNTEAEVKTAENIAAEKEAKDVAEYFGETKKAE
jgi:ClpP class serine protease